MRALRASAILAWTAALCARYRVGAPVRRTANALVSDPVWLRRPRPVAAGCPGLRTVRHTSERHTLLAVHHRSEVERIATVHPPPAATVRTLREWRREVVAAGRRERASASAAAPTPSVVHGSSQILRLHTVHAASTSPAAPLRSPHPAASVPGRPAAYAPRATSLPRAVRAVARDPISVAMPTAVTLRVPASPAPAQPLRSATTRAFPPPQPVAAPTPAPRDGVDRQTRLPWGHTTVLATTAARVEPSAASATSSPAARTLLATVRAWSMRSWTAPAEPFRAARSLDASRLSIAGSPPTRSFVRPTGSSGSTPRLPLVLGAPASTVTRPREARLPSEPLALVRALSGQTAALSVPQPGPGRPPTGLEYVRPAAPAAGAVPDADTIRREVEERVERTLVERVERLVARELAPDRAPLLRISERVSAELSEALVLERERLGWS